MNFDEATPGSRCPKCLTPDPPTDEDFYTGDLTCTICGLVLDERRLSYDAPERNFGDSENDRRHFTAVTDPSGGNNISTGIAGTGGPGKSLTREAQTLSQTIERQGESTQSRRRMEYFAILRKMTARLELTAYLINATEQILGPFLDDNPVAGNERKKRGLVGAAIVLASRVIQKRLSFAAITEQADVVKTDVSHFFKKMEAFYKQRPDKMPLHGISRGDATYPLVGPLSKLRLLKHILGTCQNVLGHFDDLKKHDREALKQFGGKSPLTVVAGVIFLVCEHKKTYLLERGKTIKTAKNETDGADVIDRKDVAVAASVAENTLSTMLNQLSEYADLLLQPKSKKVVKEPERGTLFRRAFLNGNSEWVMEEKALPLQKVDGGQRSCVCGHVLTGTSPAEAILEEHECNARPVSPEECDNLEVLISHSVEVTTQGYTPTATAVQGSEAHAVGIDLTCELFRVQNKSVPCILAWRAATQHSLPVLLSFARHPRPELMGPPAPMQPRGQGQAWEHGTT